MHSMSSGQRCHPGLSMYTGKKEATSGQILLGQQLGAPHQSSCPQPGVCRAGATDCGACRVTWMLGRRSMRSSSSSSIRSRLRRSASVNSLAGSACSSSSQGNTASH